MKKTFFALLFVLGFCYGEVAALQRPVTVDLTRPASVLRVDEPDRIVTYAVGDRKQHVTLVWQAK
jgi:hypothetical protein